MIIISDMMRHIKSPYCRLHHSQMFEVFSFYLVGFHLILGGNMGKDA